MLERLKTQPEDVFCLVADVLDDILDTSYPTQEYIDQLWISVVNDIREWQNGDCKSDKMLTAGTVWHIVRNLLCHHWDSRYHETFYAMMGETLERELKVEDKEEEKRFLGRLTDCSTELCAWINSYDPRYVFLSEEIEEVLNGRSKKKPDLKEQVDDTPILTSFIYMPKGMDIEERNKRLIGFFDALARNGKFIYPKVSKQQGKTTSQQDFLNTFIGVQTDKKLVWTNEVKRLNYLIHKLKKLNLISWNAKPKPGILQMICARFLVRKKIYTDVEGKPNKDWYWEECKITPSNLNGNIDYNDTELDGIIDVLVPDSMKKSPSESIKDGVTEIFSDEQKDVLSTEENVDEGFHPTDHQSYLES